MVFGRGYVKEGGKVEELKFKRGVYGYLGVRGFILKRGVVVRVGFD